MEISKNGNMERIKYNGEISIQEQPTAQNAPSKPHSDGEEKLIVTSELWDQIGFHKTIAGFWFNITFTLIAIITSMIFAGKLMGFFFPYPESFSYKDIVFSFFALMWMIFDIATGAVMSRYIPEANIKQPELMLHYIQYFIWYQMFTGLIQTTAISVYAIFFAPQTTMAYTVWIMLVASTTQYPGFLHVFSSVLGSLQQYHKQQTLSFITGTIVQRITELGFVYLGRIYGEANPQIGPILGIAIGAAIGYYVDDFMAMVISAVFFSSVMKQYGIHPKHCFHIQFTWAEIKPVLIYSFKTAIPGLISGPLNFFTLIITLEYIPQYTTLASLAYIGGSIADIIVWVGGTNITPLVSESYMNGKKSLTQYYVGQDIRFNSLIFGFFAPLILILYFIMPVAWDELGMIYYVLGTIFIIPRLLKIGINKFLGQAGAVLYGANRPNFGIIMGVIQSILGFGLQVLYLVVWQIPRNYGVTTIAWMMELGGMPVSIVFSILTYIYVHKKIIPIKIPGKQIGIGIVGAATITFILNLAVKLYIFDIVYTNYGFFPALIAGIIPLALILLLVYFPLTGILGAWDTVNLEEFRKAAYMSGPSKWIVVPIYKILNYCCLRSPLHNKFAMDSKEVIIEAKELLIIKNINRDELKEKLLNDS